MEVISSENYLAESPRLEEPVQSLYADEQPKKRRLRSKETHSKLAETVGIENNIMLNVEDLAKATARSVTSKSGVDTSSRDQHDTNFGLQARQTPTYEHGRGRGNRRRPYESRRSPGSDYNIGNTTTETRTSVIHGVSADRKRKLTNSESESEDTSLGELDGTEKTDYGRHLRCYEQFEENVGENAGESLSGRGNYIQNPNDGRLEHSRTSSSTQADGAIVHDRISENFRRGPMSGGRPFAVTMVDPRSYPSAGNASTMYLQQHVHDFPTQYRMQLPPEFAISPIDQRGKQLYDRSGHGAAPSSSGSVMVPQGYPIGNAQGKYGMPDGVYVQTHDLPNPYGVYSVRETMSPASSTSSGKDRELPQEQETLQRHAQHYSSPVGQVKEEHAQASPRHSFVEHGAANQAKAAEDMADSKQHNANKNRGKRNQTGKSENSNQCSQCGKTFASSSALAKHKLTHSDERRYVCHLCGKGFKRQDHLTGHMMTHRDKKPYECKYSDCDKSYCDMRSLRRHYENTHSKNSDSMHSIPSSSGQFKTESEQTSHKVKQQQEDYATAECQDSPKAAHVSHAGKPKQEVVQSGHGRKRNSDSMCSNNSEDLGRIPDGNSPHPLHVGYEQPMTAVGMLKQVVEQSQDRKGENQIMEAFPQPAYYTYPEGYKQPWYRPYQAQVIKMYQFNGQRPVVFSQSAGPAPYGPVRSSAAYPAGDPPQMVPNYPSVKQGQGGKNSDRNGNDSGCIGMRKVEEESYGMVVRESGAPTDPTSIAIVNAQDLPTQVHYKDGNPAFSPVVQWKAVPVKKSSGMPPYSMGNNPASMQYTQVSVGMSLPDRKVNHDPRTALNISIPSSQADKRCHDMVDVEHSHAKRHCPPRTSPNVTEERLLKLGDVNMKPPSFSEPAQDVFMNPPSTPARKPKPKPEPILIPCSTYGGSPVSPPIYTPPPMLSPRSIFHTPRCGGSTPLTPGRFFLGNRSRKNSLEGGDQLVEQQEVLIPEPKINIGPQFQAEIPSIASQRDAELDKHRVAVCWTPFEQETKKRRQEIEAFLDMACSVAVHGGGSNKEYALHVLYRLKGNIKQAVRHILANKSAIQKEDGLADYHYEGSEKWSAKERVKFREALNLKGKDFNQISKEVETKSVAQCVEFYYLWKATHPEAMRSRTRYAETESEAENNEYLSDNDDDNTLVFVCDFPECNSKFISRQALNGHIRVHGGSFMKPSETKRPKARSTANSECGSTNNTTASTNVSRTESKPAKPTPASSGSTEQNGGGPLPEFACKVCGRVFHKIKSRSAHMKTHVKRSDDDGESKR